MTYTYQCDDCGAEGLESPPALMGEFSESWFKTTPEGGHVSELGFDPGDIVTLCGDCTLDLLDQHDRTHV